MVKIGLQGAKGSFSEEASNVFVKNHGLKEFQLKYLISSKNVLKSLENKEIDYGIIAMENAQGGVVIESVDALAGYRCEIIEMFHLQISQNLLVKPGIHIGQITEIHSHQQALKQCRNYLSEHFWTIPLIETDDTAEAARRLSENKLPKTAGVIGSKFCSDLYGLNILEEKIHDLKNNLTLFLGLKTLGH
ncbi:MAG: prephenate dehydratase [Candidatus Marinimicrobia bacterium]|nr:prephenate dehydratase [Candidatus Neomarinimicrobiota bacterium]|tara:strand:+ start:252 stop:821 length:570 start_codon:yes stop_codon:yes gene_type:complete